MSLYYEEHPGLARQDTLFLHGCPGSHRWWHPLVQEWKKAGALGRGALILSDQRGCGQNEDWPADQSFSLDDLARDQFNIIDRMALKNAALVGHSIGALVAFKMMALEPHLFSRAVLIDPVDASGVDFGRINQELEQLFPPSKMADALKSVKSMSASLHEIFRSIKLTETPAEVPVPTLILGSALKDDSVYKILSHSKFEPLDNAEFWNAEQPATLTERLRKWFGEDETT